MKRLLMAGLLISGLFCYGYAADENFKREGNRFPVAGGIYRGTNETRQIAVDTTGQIIISPDGNPIPVSGNFTAQPSTSPTQVIVSTSLPVSQSGTWTVNSTTHVSVDNPVSVSNFPTQTQVINSTPIAVTATNSTIQVTVSTSLPVTVENFPATQFVAVSTSMPVTVGNFPATQNVLLQNGATVYNANPQMEYSGQTVYTSSGTSGLITGVTTASISPVDRVVYYYFLMYNGGNTSTYATITPSHTGVKEYLTDQSIGSTVYRRLVYPATMTYTIALPVASTMTYIVGTIK
jgi:hypothetical protein